MEAKVAPLIYESSCPVTLSLTHVTVAFKPTAFPEPSNEKALNHRTFYIKKC
jgi:hypothetical protein